MFLCVCVRPVGLLQLVSYNSNSKYIIWANNHTEKQVLSKELKITLVILEIW